MKYIDIPYESFDKNVLFDSKVKLTLLVFMAWWVKA